MLELLFLLLPVAVAYGWYMGRRSFRLDQEKASNRRSRGYAAGINFLLSDQPDKAVDLFIELLQVDPDTLDTHIALGNIFRQRGEVDRAIRIHQNLVTRSLESSENQNLAMLELARDFFAAGLFDRAESVLVKLIDDEDLSDDARGMLIQIYEQFSEWEKAILHAEKMKNDTYRIACAHYYCQLGEEALLSQNFTGAEKCFKKAVKHDDLCIRARLLLSEGYIQQQNYASAIKQLRDIPSVSPAFSLEALRLLLQMRDFLPSEQLIQMLQMWTEVSDSSELSLAVADSIEHSQNLSEAEAFILKRIQRNPTMKSFNRLMSYHLRQIHDPKALESISLLQSLVEKQLAIKPLYRCTKCGFSGKIIFWHCPSCRQWGTITPIQGLDGD